MNTKKLFHVALAVAALMIGLSFGSDVVSILTRVTGTTTPPAA